MKNKFSPYISLWLSQIPDFNPEFFDLDKAVESIAKDDMDWQPLLTISCYIWSVTEFAVHPHISEESYPKITDADKIIIDGAILNAVPIILQRVKELRGIIPEGVYDPELTRLLFHSELTIGCYYLLCGEYNDGIPFLVDTLISSYNVELQRVNFFGNIEKRFIAKQYDYNIPMTPDTSFGKHIAYYVTEKLYFTFFNFWQLMVNKVRLTETMPSETLFDNILASILVWFLAINKLAHETENDWNKFNRIVQCTFNPDRSLDDPIHDFDSVTLTTWDRQEQWMRLLDCVSYIPSYCVDFTEDETIPYKPSEARANSAVFWAWQFGQIVALLYISEGRTMFENILNEYEIGPGLSRWRDGLSLLSLFSEVDGKNDWNKSLDLYMRGWVKTKSRNINQLFLEGPDSALYWAMRIGLAEGFINSPDLVDIKNINTFHQLDVKYVAEYNIHQTLNAKSSALIIPDMDSYHQNSKQYKSGLKNKLIKDHGLWIDSLIKPNLLIEAEFAWNCAPSSWNSIIMSYGGCLEQEAIDKVINPIVPYLEKLGLVNKKGVFRENINVNSPEFRGIQYLIGFVLDSPVMANFCQTINPEARVTLREIYEGMEDIRLIRNPAAHGEEVTKEQAKKVQKVVLNTPERPGILQKVNQLKLFIEK